MFFGNGHLGRLVLQRLDPFDSRAFGSFAQGDCSWECHCSLRLWKQNASAASVNIKTIVLATICFRGSIMISLYFYSFIDIIETITLHD